MSMKYLSSNRMPESVFMQSFVQITGSSLCSINFLCHHDMEGTIFQFCLFSEDVIKPALNLSPGVCWPELKKKKEKKKTRQHLI